MMRYWRHAEAPEQETSARRERSGVRSERAVIALTEGENTPTRQTKIVPMRRRKNPAAVALGRLGGLPRK
jgi:hypothetical protein